MGVGTGVAVGVGLGVSVGNGVRVGKDIGVEKITWGSDCGNEEISEHVSNLENIFEKLQLSDVEKNRIRYQNAAEIFGEAEPSFATD